MAEATRQTCRHGLAGLRWATARGPERAYTFLGSARATLSNAAQSMGAYTLRPARPRAEHKTRFTTPSSWATGKSAEHRHTRPSATPRGSHTSFSRQREAHGMHPQPRRTPETVGAHVSPKINRCNLRRTLKPLTCPTACPNTQGRYCALLFRAWLCKHATQCIRDGRQGDRPLGSARSAPGSAGRTGRTRTRASAAPSRSPGSERERQLRSRRRRGAPRTGGGWRLDRAARRLRHRLPRSVAPIRPPLRRRTPPFPDPWNAVAVVGTQIASHKASSGP